MHARIPAKHTTKKARKSSENVEKELSQTMLQRTKPVTMLFVHRERYNAIRIQRNTKYNTSFPVILQGHAYADSSHVVRPPFADVRGTSANTPWQGDPPRPATVPWVLHERARLQSKRYFDTSATHWCV